MLIGKDEKSRWLMKGSMIKKRWNKKKIFYHYLDKRGEILKNTLFKFQDDLGDLLREESGKC